ncbi:MAG: hypothetical protein AB1500_03620 [Bacillota bacterium]
MRKKITIKEAVEHFTANRESIPVFATPREDYALQIRPEDHLYLVVELKSSAIFLARLGPELMILKSFGDKEQKAARDYTYERLKEAGLLSK